MSDLVHSSARGSEQRPGPFLARVISNFDPTYMGALEVEILQASGSDGTQSVLHNVKYMSPFYGVTSVGFNKQDPDNYTNTQKSYGMWMVPPDVGATVMIFFVDGDPKRGYWFGCVPDESMNFMVPGIAATQSTVEDVEPDKNSDGAHQGRAPTAEYNKLTNKTVGDPETVKKPLHPFFKILQEQGLSLDDTRGLTTSSARREAPSMVFGISTPGPVDKQEGANTDSYGKAEYRIDNAPVSRLGGSSFVMDDGDDKFLRKTKAYQGPPEYASVETGDTTGDVTIPHNELVRIRTRTGHQILLHNSEDLIYIGNARGTTWIEMTSMGKIDIFATDSVSIHTKNDFNVTADRDINLTAGGNINLNATKNIVATATKNIELTATEDGRITTKDFHENIGGSHYFTLAKDSFTVKGSGAVDHEPPSVRTGDTVGVPATKATKAPKSNRVPMVEPWAGHEHLDPLSSMPAATVASATPSQPVPKYFKVYTTATDTFTKYKGSTSSNGSSQ